MDKDQEKKKKPGRRAYLNDFQVNVAGEYIYNGKIIRWKAPRRENLVKLWILSLAGLTAGVVAGCLPNTGMEGTAWALLPYVIALVACVSQIWAVGRLSAAGEQIREYVFRSTAKQLPGRSFLTALFSGIAILGEAVNLFILPFDDKFGFALLLMGMELVMFTSSVLLHRIIVRLEWTE